MLRGESVWQLHAFLEKYGTKRFGTGVSVYFHLGVSATIIYLKHRQLTECDT